MAPSCHDLPPKLLMAFSILSRTQLQKLTNLTKQLTPTSQIPNFRSFTTTQNPQISNLLNSKPETQYRKQVSIANVFQRYGFSPSTIHEFLTKNKPFLTYDVSELDKSLEILLSSLKLKPNLIVSLVCNCPSVLELGFLRKWEVGIVSLGSLVDCSPRVICSVLEFSRRFQVDPHRFCSCVEVLRRLGFSDGTISRVLEEFPGVVMIDEREIKKRMEFWALQEMDTDVFSRIYSLFPCALGYGVEDRLEPLLDEFFDVGVDKRAVREEVVREPRILSFELGELRWYLVLLRRLRCRESIKEKIFSKGVINAGFAVKLRVECLCRYGLIRRDALSILKREPRSILYDIEDIERKMEFLIEKMKFTAESLFEVPQFLGVNFDKQIVRRHNVIEYLRSRGGLGFEVGLRDIIKPSRLKFYKLYVKPYPECEKLYGRFSEYTETKSRIPTGLWKHFKPPKYQDSEEDKKNLRLFSEPLV